ncbi:MAG: response regulator transcription factor [Acidimicrobiales bacterium]
MSVRLVVADDHTMMRDGLRRALTDFGLEVIGEAADGQAAVDLAEELQPDVVLMDISMPVLDGIAATRIIRKSWPGVQVVMLTMHSDESLLRQAIQAGAAGYLVKDASAEEVVDIVTQAASGETTFSPEIASALLLEAEPSLLEAEGGFGGDNRHLDRRDRGGELSVTKREVEVLRLIAQGSSTADVARTLFISPKTVKNHLASIYQKLDAGDRTQAVLRAVRIGIIKIEINP